MLVYGKYEDKQPILYGTMANIPSGTDKPIKYVDGDGATIEFQSEWLIKGRLVDAGNGRFNILGDDGKVAYQDVAMVVVSVEGVDANEDGDYNDKNDGDIAPVEDVVTPIDVTEDAGAGEGEDTGDGNDLG